MMKIYWDGSQEQAHQIIRQFSNAIWKVCSNCIEFSSKFGIIKLCPNTYVLLNESEEPILDLNNTEINL